MIEHTSLSALVPEEDADSAPFWKALTGGTLVLPSCNECGRAFFPPMPVCPRCGSSDVAFTHASGRGRIYSWVVVHRALHEAFTGDVPYTIVAVDLDEDVRLLGRLLGSPPDEPTAGGEVRFTPYEANGLVLPGFRIA